MLGDLADLLHAAFVGRDACVVLLAPVRADTAPYLDQGPVSEQAMVEEDLVVPGLLGVDLGALFRGRGHAAHRRHATGSLGESAVARQIAKSRRICDRCEPFFLGLETTEFDPLADELQRVLRFRGRKNTNAGKRHVKKELPGALFKDKLRSDVEWFEKTSGYFRQHHSRKVRCSDRVCR